MKILVVDDNAVFARGLVRALEARGWAVTWIQHGARVPGALSAETFDAAVVECVLPGLPGLRLLEQLRARSPVTRVLMVAATATIESAVEAMKLGAVDFLVKPVAAEVVAERVVVRAAAVEPEGRGSPDRPGATASPGGEPAWAAEPEGEADLGIVGGCREMREVIGRLKKVAETDAAVLLTGESGTGKELVARAIHRLGRRRSRMFLAVNCGALGAGVIDSELFGHVRGAFTSARADRRGLFEQADGGTILLDEIASTPPAFQARLLRVLEDGVVRPLGSTVSRKTDVRIIAASNTDLVRAVRAGRVREDLYYRLNVVSLVLPPLRERPGDVRLLARHFLARAAESLGRPVAEPAPGVFEALERHPWPGNVRELRNAIERALALAGGDRIELEHLELGAAVPLVPDIAGTTYASAKRIAIEAFTRAYLDALLARHGGNVTRAARAARVPRQTLHRLLRAQRARPSR